MGVTFKGRASCTAPGQGGKHGHPGFKNIELSNLGDTVNPVKHYPHNSSDSHNGFSHQRPLAPLHFTSVKTPPSRRRCSGLFPALLGSVLARLPVGMLQRAVTIGQEQTLRVEEGLGNVPDLSPLPA
jgi:hypothetical protein